MGMSQRCLCMVVTSVIGMFALVLFEFALLAALTTSVVNGDHTLVVVFASCSVLFAGACYVSVRVLACEAADYKRNRIPEQKRRGKSSVLSDEGILFQG